jgi:hypothetical protein
MNPFQTKDITLGGKTFAIKPPAFHALMAIMEVTNNAAKSNEIKDASNPVKGINMMMDVIVIGIKDSLPETERSDIESLRMPLDEISQAFNDVMEISGLRQAEGEAKAVSR